MNRTVRNRLLLFLSVFHLLSDVAYAGEAILCVGPDDHRAIESEHLVEVGCENGTTASLPSLSVMAGAASENCTDIPLRTDAELFTSSDPSPDFQPLVVASSFASTLFLPTRNVVRPRARAPAESTSIRAHRTVVLLI